MDAGDKPKGIVAGCINSVAIELQFSEGIKAKNHPEYLLRPWQGTDENQPFGGAKSGETVRSFGPEVISGANACSTSFNIKLHAQTK